MLVKRVVAFLAVTLGALGVAACAAGVYAAHEVAARLEVANERAFAAIEKVLAFAEDRVRRVHERVAGLKITTGEITHKLRDWTTLKARDRIATRLEVERRTDVLAGHLRTADEWLETSAESVRDARHLLEVGQSLGARLDPAALDEVLGHLTTVRGAVQEAQGAVGEVREFATGKDGESEESRLARVLKLLARVLATVTEADARLARCADRLAERRTEARELRARTDRSIARGAVVCYVALAWVAAGQAALCWCGLRRCVRSRSPAVPPAK